MILAGRYRLLSLAGRGGAAEVWRGEVLGAQGFRRTVAIKRILVDLVEDEQFRRMFIEEARVTSLLDHPNVVQVFDFGEEAAGLFLVMEWVEGLNLRQLLDITDKQQTPLSPALATAIGIEVLDALESAHSHVTRHADGSTSGFPIVHRDVSPSNVMLSVRGKVKLADFGFARAFDRARMTPLGIVKGKIAYLAPELARGGPASALSDLYSCGVLLWEMLSGRRLFQQMSDIRIARSLIASQQHPTVRSVRADVPAELADVVDRSLRIDPAERYQTAGEFARALRDALRKIPERTDSTRLAAAVEDALIHHPHSEPAPPSGSGTE